MPERPIIVLTASAGAGHVMAARAMVEAFERAAPGTPVELLDVLSLTSAFFRRLYSHGYLYLIKHAPDAMGWLYESMDRPHRLRDGFRAWYQRVNAGRIMQHLRAARPRLVANTHFLTAEMVADERRRGRLDCPQVTISTDYETHRLWVQPPTERYYTATPIGAAFLRRWGAPAGDVRVTGIPVRAAFRTAIERAAFLTRHGLDPRERVVLLLCGAFGVGPSAALLRDLLAMPEDAQVVVITGRNQRLRERLQLQALGARRRVLVLGFTDEMHAWMRSADVAVSKPGGLSVAEATVCGTPLVVVAPIPGQEQRNSDYLLENGAGVRVNNPGLLGYRVGELLRDEAKLERLRAAALALGRPAAADEIARDALGAV